MLNSGSQSNGNGPSESSPTKYPVEVTTSKGLAPTSERKVVCYYSNWPYYRTGKFSKICND